MHSTTQFQRVSTHTCSIRRFGNDDDGDRLCFIGFRVDETEDAYTNRIKCAYASIDYNERIAREKENAKRVVDLATYARIKEKYKL